MEVKIFNNFFNTEDFSIVKNFSDSVEYNTHFSAKGKWHQNLTLGRGNIDVYACNSDDDVYNIISSSSRKIFNMEPKVIMFYFWQPESFISWHNDMDYDAAATIYLNEEWHIDNGGLFMFSPNDNDIRAIVPEPNKCVFQRGGVMHSTTSTHWNSPVRKSIQVFF